MGGQSQSQKPNLITQSMQWRERGEEGIEFHDLKSAMGQIENAIGLVPVGISLSILFTEGTNGSYKRLGEKRVENAPNPTPITA